MKVIYELDKDDLGSIHDILCELSDGEYSDEECLEAWNLLPEHIKSEAVAWGTDDTVFRDKMFTYLRGLK